METSAAKADQAQPPKHTNRLARESSPYLLQHRHNPVDWYAWGPEAIEAARTQNKPIFLSVGYSTCYWCHVMERQSFENEAVATEMNARFVNIKVDREERPDVDSLYMTSVQLLTRQGGWPMSVFLTPDLRPFFGGTYFPPTDSHGRPGFVSLLRGIDDAWRNRPDDVEKTASQLHDALSRLALPPAPSEPITVDRQLIDQLVQRSIADYEPHFGGFGHAPKFPRETLLELLLTYLDDSSRSDAANPARSAPRTAIPGEMARNVDPANSRPDPSKKPSASTRIEQMLRHTLDAMARGGIRDQLGGGFHRYSTDAKWLVPHFEIMLYDNAMLGWVYTEAYRQFGDRAYAEIARGIFDFILREMTSPQGAFYTAFDAEVDAQEGMPYLWTKEEIDATLGADDAARFNPVYGVDRGPNFADPHHGTGTPDKNILHLADPAGSDWSPLFDEDLRALRQKLYDARRQRKQPLLDTKILTSWNALMIRALAYGGQVLESRRYVQAAEKAAGFILANHRPASGLFRTSRDGVAKYNGFLDDYAFLAQALLTLAQATGESRWREESAAIAAKMPGKFGDAEVGGLYFSDKDAKDLVVRQMTASDSPLPSGNAIAAMVLLDTERSDESRNVLAAFAASLDTHAEGMSSMVQAALRYLARHGPFTVSAATQDSAVDRPLSPEKIAEGVVVLKPHWATPTELHLRLTILAGFHINAHDPQAGSVPLIPTTLKITDSYGMPAEASVDYPPGEEQAFGFTEHPIRVYTRDVVIAIRFKSVMIGTGPLRLSLSFQPCDESACLPPVTKTVDVAAK